MPHLNRCEIIGHIGKDAVFGYNQGGRAKCSFPVAVSERYKDKNNETKELTNWFNVVVWNKLAETLKNLTLTKGICVYVSGKMNFRTFEDQDGTRKNVAELVAESVQILTPNNGKKENENKGGYYPQQEAEDNELPF